MKYDTRDCVTGLLDGEAFLRVIDDVAEHCEEDGDQFAVMVLDIDAGRRSLASRSAIVADELASVMAERLEETVASAGVVARLGQSVFGVLPHGDPEEWYVRELPSRLHTMLREPVYIAGEQVHCTTSIGVAVASPRVQADSAVKYAHDAVIRVKLNGGDATFVQKVA